MPVDQSLLARLGRGRIRVALMAWALVQFPIAPSHAEAPAGAQASAVVAMSDDVDTHMHLDGVGPSQGPPGRKPMGPGSGRPPAGASDGEDAAVHLISLMDQAGVRRAIVMPPPQSPDQAGGYQYTALVQVVSRHRDRLVLGGGGGSLNPMIQGTPPDAVTAQVRATFESKAKEIVEAGARVFGEMTALHTCMNPRHHYVAAPADHPLFLLLADLAARYDIPIDLHMEALAKDTQTPPDLLGACHKNPALLAATIPRFERLLDHNPRARIVWQHIGWDNTGQMTPELLRGLLGRHSNLFLAIKAVPDPARRNRLHDAEHAVLPEWLALFQEFPDRIVTGADEFARAPGQMGGYVKPPFFQSTWKMIASLPPELRRRIGGGNARRIYRLAE